MKKNPEKTPGIHELLCHYAEKFPDKPLLGGQEGWMTVADVRGRVEATAYALRCLGVWQGDYVALRAYSNTRTALTILALSAIGAVAVLTDPHEEVEEYLKRSGITLPLKAILSGDEAADPKSLYFKEAAGSQVTWFDPMRLPQHAIAPQSLDVNAPAFLIFTSGSTGTAKAVMLSFANLYWNLIDSKPLGFYLESDIALGALPLYHIFGLVLLMGTIVLRHAIYITGGKDVEGLLTVIEEQRITRMNGVPSLYLAMCEKKGSRSLHSLRTGFIGGGPCTEGQFCAIERTLGMTLIPVYGMSECIGISCGSYKDPQAVRAHGVGRIYPLNTVKILRGDGSGAASGEEGEVCVDGPSRMVGYYGDENPRAPFLATGDLGRLLPDGTLVLTGRKKDLIIRNGLNISPARIEQALLSLPEVKAACVVGIPDEACGEIPAAMAVSALKPEQILHRLSALLAKNELPAFLRTVEAIPLTASGKPDRQRVRKELSA